MTAQAIQVDNISASYGRVAVLRDISFEVKAGSMMTIIGPNASGKTTLLKVCMGHIAPDKGGVRLLGKRPEAVRDRIGYVPQRFTFDPTIPVTVEEFMRFSHADCPSGKIEERLGNIGVGDVRNDLLGTLSPGQLQRVLVARALLHDPAVVFMDEPASGIDVAGEESFYQLVEHVHREHNTTVVMASHEVDVVYRYADQVICLNTRMVCEGVPREALTPEVMEELYGGSAAMYPHTPRG